MKKSMIMLLFIISSVLAFGQTKTITGKILDLLGNPIANAVVKGKGQKLSTITEGNGNFMLTLPDDVYTIEVSANGYNTILLSTSGDLSSVKLMANTETVIVTGYKSQTKKSYTGSAAIVSGEKIRTTPIASFDQALQGQTPGVLMRATSGQPGASGSIVIRGKGSLSLSNEALYIVDGIQISGADFAALNPNDIENLAVLKDGVAVAQYGSRGGNGVVVVTTRRGRVGKPVLEVDAYTGWSEFVGFNDFRLMTTAEKIAYELRRGGTSLETYSPAVLDSMRKINTDWTKILTRTGKTNSVNASASGGSDKTRYYAAVNYFKQEGTLKNTGYDRITGRINLSQDAGNFAFGLNTTGTYSNYQNTAEQNASIASPLNALQWANPYEQEFVKGFYNAAGNFVRGGNELTRERITETFQPMPATELFWNNNTSKSIRLVTALNAEYKVPFVKGLSVKTVYGIDYRQYDDFRFVDRRTYSAGSNPRPLTGSSANFRTNSFITDFSLNQRITNTNSINYSGKFGNHTFDGGAYYEYVQAKSKNNGRTLYGLASNFQNDAGSTVNADLLPRLRFGGVERRIESYFGLLNYGFKNKYFLNANIRRDGASVFGPKNKYATFGGVGVSWSILDESFMDNIAAKLKLTNLKLRASYGTVGNGADQLGSYAWQASVANRLYNAVNGSLASTLENTSLGWETRNKANIGLDFSLNKNKINGTIEYYNETTEDLILASAISSTSGFSTLNKNVGSVRNKGVEINGNIIAYEKRSFKITVNGNVTFNKNAIVALADRDSIVSGLNILAKGQSLNSIFVVEYVGVNPANGNALYRKLDGSTTETYSSADRKIVGNSEPGVFGGFGLNVEYKNFTLGTQFSFIGKSKVVNYERNFLENPDYYFDNVSADLLREWQRPGDVTDIPRPDNVFQAETTRFLEDNSFVRLRNISLGYNVPESVLSKLKLKGVMFYMNGTNLWTKTKFRGRDPETANTVQAGAQYPALKTIQAGVRFNF